MLYFTNTVQVAAWNEGHKAHEAAATDRDIESTGTVKLTESTVSLEGHAAATDQEIAIYE